MSDSIDLLALMAEAEEAGDGDGGEFFKPDEGTYRVEIIRANARERNGMPNWGLFAKVLDGEDAGSAFWFNLNLTKEYPQINNQTFGALSALGVEKDTIGLGAEAVAQAVIGAQADVTVKYRPNKKDPSKDPFLNVRVKAVSGGGGWTPPTGDGPPAL